KSIVLSSDSSDDSKGPSIANVPKEGSSIASVSTEGPSAQGLLDWYGYDTVEEYLEKIFFLSTDKDSTDEDTTNNDSTDEDTINESYSPKSKGKYVPVSQKHNPKVIFKSPILIKGCVLGLANVHTWDDILMKFGVRKPESCVDNAKGKREFVMLLECSICSFCVIEVFGLCVNCILNLHLAIAACICIAFEASICCKHLQLAIAACIYSWHLQVAFAASICNLQLKLAFATSICKLHLLCICSLQLKLAFAASICKLHLQFAIEACICSKHLQVAFALH
ncbi:hypothetical protein Tco_0057259, partial [Tanacetum coccineum]